MITSSPRHINIIILIAVIGLMGYGLYSQYVMGLIPCPLCMTQRAAYCLIGGFALIAIIHKQGYKIYSLLIALASLGGIAAAGRQVWLQHLPPELVPACGPSLEYMLETFPFAEALKMLILGEGNCAIVDWTFVGLSMAEWSLLWFVGFLGAALWQLLRKPATAA
ncbi:disulfide bond formation protein B [Dasania marina]|uniref:disulfide bond formation protein B n=1 Tax=Dasania marina TaxID=471499 RepID=UPI00037EFBFC|nr:disulfide bond formation protein B [Dasania marina]